MSVRRLAAGVDLVALARAYPERYPHLLRMALMGQAPARFSVLFAFPGRAILGYGGMVLDHLYWLGAFESRATPIEPNSNLPFCGCLFITLVIRGAEVRFRIGVGIVTDSDPEAELEETRHKARALLDALCQ